MAESINFSKSKKWENVNFLSLHSPRMFVPNYLFGVLFIVLSKILACDNNTKIIPIHRIRMQIKAWHVTFPNSTKWIFHWLWKWRPSAILGTQVNKIAHKIRAIIHHVNLPISKVMPDTCPQGVTKKLHVPTKFVSILLVIM